jgi:DNA-binding beta-propeller fold protein YncE
MGKSVAVTCLLVAVLGSGMAGAGCASKPETLQPVFYPPAPNTPRVQFLAAYSGSDSLKTTSAFIDFVVGKETGEQLRKPYGAVIRDGKIYVCDTGLAGIAVLDLKSRKFSLFGNEGLGQIKVPINLAIDADGSKFIADTGLNQILVFDKDNRYVRALGVKDQFKPTDVVIRGNLLYVCDIQNHRIVVLDKKTGKEIRSIGQRGMDPGQFNFPSNLDIDPDGNLYVSDTGNFRVQKLDPDGKSLGVYGTAGDAPGNLSRPKGVALDRENRLFVVDAAFSNVQIFDADRQLLLFFGEAGTDRGDLNLPAGISLDYDNLSYFKDVIDSTFVPEALVLVVSQYGTRKINVYALGHEK